MNMKRLLRVTVFLVGVLTVAVVATAPAHADTANERAFVHDIRATGWVTSGITDAQIIATGWQTCRSLVNMPTVEVINQQVLNGLPQARAETAVNLAIKDLCPGSGW
jgi:hypothetical protein